MTDFPTMRAAFRTTVSGGGKYEMVFRFPSMEAMHAADDEWRAALATPASDVAPVAWIKPDWQNPENYTGMSPVSTYKQPGWIPLYAHPPAHPVDPVAGGEALRDALVSAACDGIADDYMTSEKHHPGYVLIPSAKFEAILAALKGPAA